MINVDISNIWGLVSLPRLQAMEKEIFDAHKALTEGTGPGSRHLGWLNLPTEEITDEIRRLQQAAKRIREESEACVIVGVGGSALGSRAAIELLQGTGRNFGKGRGNPQIFYAGNSLSTRKWNELMGLLEGRDFSVIAISKSGTTLEPAIAFRGLRELLERRYGPEGAKRRIYAVTDPFRGALRKTAEEQGWESFVIPTTVGGRFSVLTPVGLLPMAVAGIDISEILRGAAEAKKRYDLRSLENPVWRYAAVRNLMHRNGKQIELLAASEPDFHCFGNWWRHLFSEAEGKDGKGLFPVTAELTADLHTLGQMLQEGPRNIFETMLRFDAPERGILIPSDENDPERLNYLAGKTLEFVDTCCCRGALEAHVDGGVPVLVMECGKLDACKVGELFYFFELSCGISGYILGVNPFNHPGTQRYKGNLYALLGRPGYEI